MTALLMFLFFLLGMCFLQAAALGMILPGYRALKAGHPPRLFVIVPPGYQPQPDIIPTQNRDIVYITREEFERLQGK